MKINRTLIIGFGHHAKRIYYPVIKGSPSGKVVGFVDLKSNKAATKEYLKESKINLPALFVDSEENQTSLSMFAKGLEVNSVVISTGPDSHVKYAQWAFREGYHVIMDKPVHSEPGAAFNKKAALAVQQRYEDVLADLDAARQKYPDLVCEVLTQRRFHAAFKLVKQTIEEVYSKTLCPITYYYAFHNDGQWRLPQEIKDITYHGFVDGTGKASHSGYHFFDLVSWFTETFREHFGVNKLLVKSWPNFPQNYTKQVNDATLQKVFPSYAPSTVSPLNNEKFGELDVMSTIQLMSDDAVVTHAQIDLLHSGISARSWANIDDRDLYKDNGRVRQEQHYISMGPFLSVSLSSWQSKPFGIEKVTKDIYAPGHEFNLDITICRNNELIGGKAAQTLSLADFYKPSLSDYSRGHQEDARKEAVYQFYELIDSGQNTGDSSLESHYLSSLIMTSVYQSMATRTDATNVIRQRIQNEK